MEKVTIPAIGTRVEVHTHYPTLWMNSYHRPTVGIVAHSNPWDKPETFRLVGVDNCLHESTIALSKVASIKILGTSKDPNNPSAVVDSPPVTGPKTFEIQGSKDNIYIVTLDGNRASCTCPAGSHGRICKHIKAARELAG